MSNNGISIKEAEALIKDLENRGIFNLPPRTSPEFKPAQAKAIAELRGVIKKLDVSLLDGKGAANGITVLYSGSIDTLNPERPRYTGEVIEQLQDKNNLRILNNTKTFEFLGWNGKVGATNETLNRALTSIFGDGGLDRPDPKSPDFRSKLMTANEFLYGEIDRETGKRINNGAFDDMSRNFAAGAKGDVIAIIPKANAGQVFGATELKALLENGNVTSINGLPRNALLELVKDASNITPDELTNVFNKVKAASAIQIRAAGLHLLDPDAPIDPRALNKYLDYAGMDMVAFIKKYPKAAIDAIDSLDGEDLKFVQKHLGMGTEFSSGKYKTGKFDKTKHIGKLGLITLGLGLAFAVREAKAAEAAGDHERAKDIMAEWAVGEAGSEVAGTAATFLTTLAGTALLGLSGPVAAVAGVAVGIVAGIYGEDAAKELYRLTKDMDHNGRMDLFDRLGTLTFGQDFKPNEIPEMLQKQAVSLKPEISLEEFVRKAKSDIAYRYALRELNTFVAEGADYTPFNQKGTLNLWDAENPSANPQGMTENYIRDRARMALLQMRYLKNGLKLARDLTDDMVQGDWDFMDHSKHPYAGDIDRPLTFSIDGNGITTDDRRVVFGSNGSDDKEYDKVNLEGSGRDDRIYGLGGNDRLIGKDGNDYLEGGEGDDTYVLSSKESGVDTILDTDGKGALEVDERRLANLNFAKPDVPISSANSGKVYYADDGKYRFSHVDGTQWLFAARDANGGYKPLTYINHWKNGDLGIKVDETSNPGVKPESAYFMYDHANNPGFFNYNASASPYGVRIRGSNIRPSQFTGSGYDDVIFTGDGGSHHVLAYGGNDYIHGGSGREYIVAGQNNINMKDENDTVYGGANNDIIIAGAGNDTVWAEDGSSDFEKPIDAKTDDEKRGDWISGQYGSDTIYGSARKDILTGGEGNDEIRGGAGDDLILGDADYAPASGNPAVGTATEIKWWADGRPRLYPDGGFALPNRDTFSWEWAATEENFKITSGSRIKTLLREVRVQGTGNDVLHGGEGHDWMAGQAGSDVLYGGAGNDTMFGDDSVAMPEGFASGDDKLYAGSGADKLHGGAGNDLLDASEKDGEKDQLFGDDGNDELKGGTGGDELHGGAGDDLLRASGEDQTLMDGGSGNDAFYGGIGDDTMRDEDGNDHYVLSPGNDTIEDQGSGYDTYHLSFGNLFYAGTTTVKDSDGKGKIFYRGQAITADRVYAVSETEWYTDDDSFKLVRSGNDLVITNATPGSQGKAVFSGFFNSEEFLGLKLPSLNDANQPVPDPKPQPEPDPKPQPEPDPKPQPELDKVITGTEGDDKLTGGNDPEHIFGLNGNDTLRGNGGGDILDGGAGNDVLEGGAYGSDTYVFRKGYGHDIVRDYAANDAQADTLRFTGASTKDAVFTREGNDLVVKAYGSDDQVTLTRYFTNADRYHFQFDDATLEKADIAKLPFDFIGTEKNDTFNGWQSDDTIHGDLGNDRISGNAGNDTLHGDAGDDTLYGNEGDDHLLGGEGNDTLDGGNGNDHLEGADGSDILRGQSGSDTLDGGAGDDVLEGGAYGSDTYVFRAGHGRDTVRDYAANDGQADTLRFEGAIAKDAVFAREGNDLVVKAYGSDDQVTLKDYFASGSADRYHFQFDDATLEKADIAKLPFDFSGTEKNDVINGWQSDDTIHGGLGNDRISGNAGNDTLHGDAGDDTLYGNDGDDHLLGGEGNDTLDGGNGNDHIEGGDGSDILRGQAGSDTLDGGAGDDVLEGGAYSSDTYVFRAGHGCDTVRDYAANDEQGDTLRFEGASAKDAVFAREGNNLIVKAYGSDDQVMLTGYFAGGANRYHLQFDDVTYQAAELRGKDLVKDGLPPRKELFRPVDAVRHAAQPVSGLDAYALQQSQQMLSAMAAMQQGASAQDALAMPDLQPHTLLAAGNS